MSEEIKKEEELDEIPKLRTPAETYVVLFGGIIAIVVFTVVMTYAWMQALG